MGILSGRAGHVSFVLKRRSDLLWAGQLAGLLANQIITGATANPSLYTVSLQVTYSEPGRTQDTAAAISCPEQHL